LAGCWGPPSGSSRPLCILSSKRHRRLRVDWLDSRANAKFAQRRDDQDFEIKAPTSAQEATLSGLKGRRGLSGTGTRCTASVCGTEASGRQPSARERDRQPQLENPFLVLCVARKLAQLPKHWAAFSTKILFSFKVAYMITYGNPPATKTHSRAFSPRTPPPPTLARQYLQSLAARTSPRQDLTTHSLRPHRIPPVS
jgi:hypothetical protein